jgi:hypothetical protein
MQAAEQEEKAPEFPDDESNRARNCSRRHSTADNVASILATWTLGA